MTGGDPAGLGRRFAARALDGSIGAVLWSLSAMWLVILAWTLRRSPLDLEDALVLALAVAGLAAALHLVYHVCFIGGCGQTPGKMALDLPDNITVSRRGTLVVCEDSTVDNYVRGLSRGGQLWDIALNRLRSSTGADRSNDEFAGSTFSPDGHTLFVNIQAGAGMTFAIWGPWERIGV